MGLDFVEIILQIEDEFKIEFDEKSVPTIETFGNLVDTVAAQLNVAENNEIQKKLQSDALEWIQQHSAIPLTMDMEIRQVFPKPKQRIQFWRAINYNNIWMPCVSSRWGCMIGFSVGLLVIVALIFLCNKYASLYVPFIFFVVCLVFGWLILGKHTEHLFWNIPLRYKTIADAVQLIAWQRLIQHHKQDNTLAISKTELELRLKELLCNFSMSEMNFDKIDRNTKLKDILDM